MLSPPIVEAWIEIVYPFLARESIMSPPIVEAWIEIEKLMRKLILVEVASHSGGVD